MCEPLIVIHTPWRECKIALIQIMPSRTGGGSVWRVVYKRTRELVQRVRPGYFKNPASAQCVWHFYHIESLWHGTRRTRELSEWWRWIVYYIGGCHGACAIYAKMCVRSAQIHKDAPENVSIYTANYDAAPSSLVSPHMNGSLAALAWVHGFGLLWLVLVLLSAVDVMDLISRSTLWKLHTIPTSPAQKALLLVRIFLCCVCISEWSHLCLQILWPRQVRESCAVGLCKNCERSMASRERVCEYAELNFMLIGGTNAWRKYARAFNV